VYESPIRATAMTDLQRRALVQKAKADRLAFDTAQLLSLGESSKAVSLAGESMTVASREHFELWLRHYATTRFNVARGTVNDFLTSLSPAVVAV
jgi:hypothetical protein